MERCARKKRRYDGIMIDLVHPHTRLCSCIFCQFANGILNFSLLAKLSPLQLSKLPGGYHLNKKDSELFRGQYFQYEELCLPDFGQFSCSFRDLALTINKCINPT